MPSPSGAEESERLCSLPHVLCLFAAGLAFALVGTMLAYIAGRYQPLTWTRRVVRVYQNTATMCFAWCVLWATWWQLFRMDFLATVSATPGTLAGQIVLALVVSLIAFAVVCTLNKIEDRVGPEKLGGVMQSIVTAVGVLVGFSWQLAFAAAAAAVASQTPQPGGPVVSQVVIAGAVALQLLPAWRQHILEKVLRYRQFRAERLEALGQAPWGGSGARAADGVGFWEEGPLALSRLPPAATTVSRRLGGNGGQDVWRFVRRQDDPDPNPPGSDPMGRPPSSFGNVGPQQQVMLKVTIMRAAHLRNADWMPGTGKSDPYCTCEIVGKPSTKFTSHTVDNDLNPVWNHAGEIREYIYGDTLLFTVYNSNMMKDSVLGRASLSTSQFYPNGFEGDVMLVDAGRGSSPTLTVRIVVAQQPQPGQLGRPGQSGQLAQMLQPTGWYAEPSAQALKPLG